MNDNIKLDIPDDILNMSVKELFSFDSNENINIDKQDNKIKITIIRPEGLFCLEWKRAITENIDNNLLSIIASDKMRKEYLLKDKISTLRSLGLTQNAIATALGISQSTVSNYINYKINKEEK